MIITGGSGLSRGRVARHKKGTGKGRQPRALGGALEELVTTIGIAAPLRRFSVLTSWEEIVGEQVAKVALPERIEDGVLIVRVATAPWRAELTMRRGEILEKIVESVGAGIVRDIRFR
jgi:predicted nucleic acid-binding Zn ribbon protein